MSDFMKDTGKAIATRLGIKILLNPKVLLVLFVIFFIFLVVYMILGEGDTGSGIDDSTYENIYTLCTPVDMEDREEFDREFVKQFNDKGAFDNSGETFLQVANRYEIDPVLLASIAFHETGYGTSDLVINKNNPGGLYNSADKEFFHFDSLAEGLDRMASNLYDNYISEGLVTIRQIGNKYAPLGVENDPNNLNAHWVPNVTNITNEFGGLIMHCEELNFGNGELAYPMENRTITSPYGMRIHPISGVAKFHKGIDFACNRGDPVYASMDGTVVDSVGGCSVGNGNCGGGYGNRVLLEHNGYYTLYAHLTDVIVNDGDVVTTSQQIGTCGTTGSSTGNHLHFEVQLSMFGEHQDPMPYLEGEDSG